MTTVIKRALDKAVDTFEKCSSPGSRAGNLIERVGKMDAAGVPLEAIAALMTARSFINKVWTVAGVQELRDAHLESQSGTLVTAEQATALMNDCHEQCWDGEPKPMPA